MSQEREKPKGFTKKSDTNNEVKGEQIATPGGPEQLLEKIDGRIKVIHGANDDTFDGLVGQKVGTVRASLVDAFNIPADALALVDGKQVDNNHILTVNSTLEFIRQAGVKGATDV